MELRFITGKSTSIGNGSFVFLRKSIQVVIFELHLSPLKTLTMALFISQILAHWAHAFPFLSMSANDFYSSTETLIREHDFPNIKIERVKNKEGGLLSASREYLRIKHKELVYEICAMPFGKDFCISSWFYESEGTMRNLLKFTKVGDFLAERASKKTFYQADEDSMFQSCVHGALMEAIDKMNEGKGKRLSDLERQMKDGGM